MVYLKYEKKRINMNEIFKIELYIPETHLEKVKDAIFAAGAGKIGDYDRCCWQCAGQGQFLPMDGSRPYVGKQGAVETVAEYKVELVCPAEKINAVIDALKKSHPYETPAFQFWKVNS
jgi:hypothetical protein